MRTDGGVRAWILMRAGKRERLTAGEWKGVAGCEALIVVLLIIISSSS